MSSPTYASIEILENINTIAEASTDSDKTASKRASAPDATRAED